MSYKGVTIESEDRHGLGRLFRAVAHFDPEDVDHGIDPSEGSGTIRVSRGTTVRALAASFRQYAEDVIEASDTPVMAAERMWLS